MKHRFLTLISSLLLLTACSDSFLERAPEGNYVDVTYYTSDDALEQATAPLYNRAWFDLNSRAIVPLGSNRANDNFSRWGAPEFTNFKVTALSENLANAWTGFYSVITMANAVISDVQTKCSNSVSERAKRTAIAEARLMRACAYFYMVRLWGPVIIIEDNDKVVANPMQPLHREEDGWNSLFVTSLMQSRIFLKWQPPKDVSTHGVQKACLPKSTSPAQAGKEAHATTPTWRKPRNWPLT